MLCPPNSSTKFRDLPLDQQIGGYPKPSQLSDAIDDSTLDSEGRCVILEFPAFVVIGVYIPATRDETRTEFRESYIDALDARVRNLVSMGKQVFLCGDLNIVRSELDTAGLAERLRKEGMTLDDFWSTPPRRFLNQLVFGGRVVGERDEGRGEPVLWDLCREFHPTRPGMYTCWETRKNARPGNFGNRIDYVLCSSAIKDWFIDANIQEGLLGSDHCPVYATIGDPVSFDGTRAYIEDIMNPPGMFKDGKRQRDWSSKDLLPTSAKLIPEFDRRQSIRDMFFKKATPSAKTNAAPAQAGSSDAPSAVDASFGEVDNANHRISQASSQAAASVIVNNTTSASPDKPAPPKRHAEAAGPPRRFQKKGKIALNRENSTKSTPGLSQSSLKGFFKPKTPTPDVGPAADNSGGSNNTTPAQKTDIKCSPWPASEEDPRGSELVTEPATENDVLNSPSRNSEPDSSSTEKVFDPIQAKESWSKLLGKRVVPKCEHGEDCQMLVTKKAGINCGTCSPSVWMSDRHPDSKP